MWPGGGTCPSGTAPGHRAYALPQMGKDGTVTRTLRAARAQAAAAGGIDRLVPVDSTVVRGHQPASGGRRVVDAGAPDERRSAVCRVGRCPSRQALPRGRHRRSRHQAHHQACRAALFTMRRTNRRPSAGGRPVLPDGRTATFPEAAQEPIMENPARFTAGPTSFLETI